MASEKSSTAINVSKVCQDLSKLHSPHGWQEVSNLLESFFGKNLTKRAKFLNAIMYAPGPFKHDPKLTDQKFHVLQGDVISTNLANVPEPLLGYDDNTPSFFVVVPNSCLVQEKRLKQVLLARLYEIKNTDKAMMSLMDQCLKMKSIKYFYMPPLEPQPNDCIGNIALFPEVAYIRNDDLQTATRIASLSEFGWYFFNFFLTVIFTKPSSDDRNIRKNSQASFVEL